MPEPTSQHPEPPQPGASGDPAYDTHLERARLGLATVLLCRDETPAPDPEIFEHSARVALLAERMADALGLSRTPRDSLLQAATLHEVGMVAVPPDLIRRPAPLGCEELRRVRAQAMIGAEIIRATYDARIAELVENQYRDYAEMVEDYEFHDYRCLLAGILRVADVIDAVMHPRPYQDPLSADQCADLLGRGAGSRFHPLVVEAALPILRCPAGPARAGGAPDPAAA